MILIIKWQIASKSMIYILSSIK